jgi:GT2 family glycosyltransferase
MFIRHALFAKLGGFDSRYFAYFEDADLSVRAHLEGFKCKVVPNSVLYHLHCGSSGGEWSATFSRLVAFSHLLFTSKFAPKNVWQSRLSELKRAAKEQFEVYLQTKDLNSTPQLRAYLNYLKKPHVFQVNRFKRGRHSVALEKYPFSSKD